jgi:hypothetical protein
VFVGVLASSRRSPTCIFELRRCSSKVRRTIGRRRTESPSSSSSEELNRLDVGDVVPQFGSDDTNSLVEDGRTHASDCAFFTGSNQPRYFERKE